MKVILPNERFVNAQEKTVVTGVDLSNEFIDINNDEEIQDVNLSDYFQYERELSKTYKVYGKIDYSSILNNLKLNYFVKSDFFQRHTNNASKNIMNSFDVYLVKKAEIFDKIQDKFIYQYEVLLTPDQIDIYPCSFSRNIFHEQIYLYNVKQDIDISNLTDGFNKEITSLYFYFKYKNINPFKREQLYSKLYVSDNNDITFSKNEITEVEYEVGDLIYGELVEYEKNSFDEKILDEQTHFIDLQYSNISRITFKYNPFIEIKLREYSDNINFANIKMKDIIDIPKYAKKIDDNGNYIWKELLDYGFIDPVSENGFDFPFLNGKHYVFNNLGLYVVPEMNDTRTAEFFKEIKINSYNTDLFKINPLNIIDPC